MIKSMAPKPIIFACANPDPEITPEEVATVRDDAIVATGRSDYPNQVNNVLGFPYIFRGALDVRATSINEDMKIACARAIAKLAREDVPDEVAAAYHGERPRFGRNYIIPVPFDPRLIREIPPAVAKAAMDSGVARHPIVDMDAYKNQLSARLSPTAGMLQVITDKVRRDPKRVVFAEGEEERVIRAAITFRDTGLGHPILIGREEQVRETLRNIGLDPNIDLDIRNARYRAASGLYADFLYKRLQTTGLSHARLRAPRQQRPQHLLGLHGRDGRRGRDGDGRDAQLRRGARRRAARHRPDRRPPRHRRDACRRARPDGARRRHQRP